jgi:hypothetical protein
MAHYNTLWHSLIVPAEIQKHLNSKHCNCYVEFYQFQVSSTLRNFKAQPVITKNKTAFALHCRLAKIGLFFEIVTCFSVLQNTQNFC